MRYLLFFLILITIGVNAQVDWDWKKFSTNDSKATTFASAFDTVSKSLIIGGFFEDQINDVLSSNNNSTYGGRDGFLAKINPDNGNTIWSIKIGGSDNDEVLAITVDDLGNIYVGGEFRSTAQFQGTSGLSQTLNSGGDEDAFIAKYNTDGILQWVSQGESTKSDAVTALYWNNNKVYATGYYEEDFDWGSLSLSVDDKHDFFVLSISDSGVPQWMRGAGEAEREEGTGIYANNSNVYVTGVFNEDDIAFYGTGFNLNNSDSGNDDSFIACYSTTGALQWVRGFNGNKNDKITGIVGDASSITVVGCSEDGITPGNGSYEASNHKNVFVCQLDLSGNTLWFKDSNPGNNTGQEGAAITCSAAGEIVITGIHKNAFNFDGLTESNVDKNDLFVVSLDKTNGTPLWSKSVIGFEDNEGFTICANPLKEEIFVGGNVRSNINFNGDNQSAGNEQTIFYARLRCQPGTADFNVSNLEFCQSSSTNVVINLSGNAPYSFDIIGTYDTVSVSNWMSNTYTMNYNKPSQIYSIENFTANTCLSESSSTIDIIRTYPISNNSISANQTLCDGAMATDLAGSQPQGGNSTSAAGTNGTFTYLWESSLDNSTWSSASGTNNTQNYSPGTLSQTTYFRRTVSSGTCASSVSNVTTITIEYANTNNSITADQTLCDGAVATDLAGSQPQGGNSTSATGTNGTFTYLWELSLDNSTWSSASGTNNTQNYSPGTLSQTTYFRRTVSSGTCASSVSNVTTITIEYANTNNSITADQTLCDGAVSTDLAGSQPQGGNSTSAAGTNGTFTYLWESSLDNITFSAASGTNNTQNYSPGTLSQTTYFRRIVSSGTCASSVSNVTTINIEYANSNNSITADQTVCDGAVATDLAGSQPEGGNSTSAAVTNGTFTYLWESSLDNSTWSSASGTNNTQNYSPGTLSQTTYFRRTVSSGTCASSTSNVTTITIEYANTNNSITADQTLCDGAVATDLAGSQPQGGNSTSATGTNGTFTYLWELSLDNITFSSASGTNNTQNYSPGTLSQTTYFRRIVSSGTCASSVSNVVTIEVYELLSNNIISQDISSCGLLSTAVFTGSMINGGNGVYTYLWEESLDNTTWMPAQGVNTLADYTLNNILQTTYYRRIAYGDGCQLDTLISSSIEATIFDEPDVSMSVTDSICEGSEAEILFSINGGASPYNISYNDGTIKNITETNLTTTQLFSPLSSQNVVLIEITDANNCTTTYNSSEYIEVLEQPIANAGESISVCDSIANLSPVLSVGIGRWEINSGLGEIVGNSFIDTSYSSNQLIWIEENVFCSDTAYLNVNFDRPLADFKIINDTVLDFQSERVVWVDSISDGVGEWYVIEGSGYLENPQNQITNCLGLSQGKNVIRYELTNGVCNPKSKDVIIEVNDLFIPDGFSPDGDLVNDKFEILGIENTESAKISIFNRWGVEVFASEQYSNEWNGLGKSGELLPEDTYYYVLTVNGTRDFNGYIILRR